MAELHESNPMLGRCRLGVSYPEIYEAQLQALFEAATTFEREQAAPVQLKINERVGHD